MLERNFHLKLRRAVYAWTPGAAAAIGIDQFNGGTRDGVKFCVLTAATARTSSTEVAANLGLQAGGGQNTGEVSYKNTIGALLLKNESAAATYLDVGLFHICMLASNSGGLEHSRIVELATQLMKSSETVSKNAVQFAPLMESWPKPTNDGTAGQKDAAKPAGGADGAKPPATGAAKN